MNRSLAALAALAAALALPAAATTHSTDYTDLWYLPAESGWGVNVIQQNDIIFATFFVYGSDGTARWFVLPDGRSVASSPGQNQFTGALYSTTGTFYGTPWGGPTNNTQVGSATFQFTSPTAGTLSYTASGVTVTKSIQRQTWRANNLTGNYLGGMTANTSNCRNGATNGQALIFGDLTIGHTNAANPTFRVDFFNSVGAAGTCTYTGAYVQDGKLGRVSNGTFSCTLAGVSSPPAGTFTMTQIEANTNGVSARFTALDQYCNYDGFFGGLRDVL